MGMLAYYTREAFDHVMTVLIIGDIAGLSAPWHTSETVASNNYYHDM